MVGWANPEVTVSLADAATPVPPSFELRLPVVFIGVPTLAPVTFTEKVHIVLANSVAPVSTMDCVAVVVGVPPHWLDALLATVSPDGSVSEKPTFVRVGLESGFARWIHRHGIPPTPK